MYSSAVPFKLSWVSVEGNDHAELGDVKQAIFLIDESSLTDVKTVDHLGAASVLR